MADEQEQEQKTEQPTAKRLEEALKKGNVPFSREVTSFLILAVLALTVGALAPSILRNAQLLLMPFVINPESLPADSKGLGELLIGVVWKSLFIIAVPVLCVMAAAVASRFVQSGFVISAEPIKPKWSKISPLAGLKRLFSMRSVVEFVKSLLKLIIIGAIAFIAVYPELPHLKQLPDSSVLAMLLFLGKLALRMCAGVVIAMFFIALFDLLYQRFAYFKSLRMTKQEIKDEYKQMEGDPMIKRRLRQLRMERARQRMMAAVPEADVVITNPTHFAVALKYDAPDMKAPKVVAKGQDLIALKIREIAEENDVPVVQNPPLARALFASCDLDEEIPTTHYEAVAKIISYVYQLKGKRV